MQDSISSKNTIKAFKMFIRHAEKMTANDNDLSDTEKVTGTN